MDKLNRITVSIGVAFLTLIFSQQALGLSSGISGYSGSGANTCSQCHSGGTAPSVVIAGPNSVSPSSTNTFTLTISGGQQKAGGLDVSATGGTLVSTQSTTKLLGNEITHTARATAVPDGSVSWSFNWTAPASTGSYTLYGAGLSANADGTNAGDAVALTSKVISVSTNAPSPPIAVIVAPMTAAVGVSMSVDGSQSQPSTGNVLTSTSYAWNFGDGVTANTVQANHTFTTAGVFTVTLTVTDSGGLSATTFVDITVGGPQVPFTNAGGPYTGSTGQAVNFDASLSAVTTIKNYIWDFGDGTPVQSVTTPKISHTFAQAGSYTVTLAAQGINNLIGFDSVVVVINDVTTPPPPPATDGASLYTNFCQGCHGPLATSAKLNKTSTQIANAISSNAGGVMGTLNSQLSLSQIQAIANALVSVTTPPPSTGATLYATFCQGCHGTLANSTKLNRSATQISGAILANAGGQMGTLNTLTVAQIQAIADALVTVTPPPPVTDGATLYGNYCQACHGPLASSSKLNRTASQITTAISSNAGGVMGSLSSQLSATQIQAIATALVRTTPPPPVTDGATLYATYCQSCHGPLATSAKLNRTATQITNAISSNAGNVMGSLNGQLSTTQIQAIATALVSTTPPPTTDGTALYGTYCQSCHGALASSAKLNRTATQIQNAIGSNAGGVMGSLSNLSSAQIQAIATALASVTPAPTTGEGLYNAYCVACHGAGGLGGLYENVSGASTRKISSALSTVSLMQSISLTSVQIQSISDYLNGINTTPPPTTTDGATLYGTYCQGCHGQLANSSKLNRTAQQIQTAITNNAGGQMGSLNGVLSTTQIQAIATALSTVAPPPPATDGVALYGSYCQSCHGALATSSKLNRTATQITTAISTNAGGVMGSLSGSLSATQIQAIATALAGVKPAPTTGVDLYNAYCASCHGAGGNGGPYEGIRNSSATQITNALATVPLMQSISLTSGQKQAISSYLSGTSYGGTSGGGGGGD